MPEILTHMENYDGLCLACRKWTCGGVEPDAHGYKCDFCGELKVVGAEEALLMGEVSSEELGDDEEGDAATFF